MAFLPGLGTAINDIGSLVGGQTTTVTQTPPLASPAAGMSPGVIAAMIGGGVLLTGLIIVLATRK